MKNHSAVIFVFLFLYVSAFVGAVKKEDEDPDDEWFPIKNINDPHVVEIAQFAVTQYNKQSGKKLSFVKTIKGEVQIVFGINYRLVLTANDGSATKSYEALVDEKRIPVLTSFKPLG